MTAPDRLRVLLDRACRGVASAAEAEQLRADVAQLQQRAEGAERQYELAMEGWNHEADAHASRLTNVQLALSKHHGQPTLAEAVQAALNGQALR